MSKDVYMLTLDCANKRDCNLRLRVGRFLSKPALSVGMLRICPACGGPAFTTTDSDEDYWEALSNAYKLPVEIVHMLYDTWDSNKHNRFSDHVSEMVKEAVA